MKLYAQHGYGVGNKISEGIDKDYIDGIIFSPRDIKRNKLRKKLEKYENDDIDLLFDPQLYVSLFDDEPTLKKRYLDTWNYYRGYRKSHLEQSKNIDDILQDYYKTILSLKTTSIISPNIYLSKSFNSIEAVISKNFIRRANSIFKEKDDNREVYASLIIDWEAFLNKDDFEEFLDDLTLINNKPDGIYLVIGSQSLNPQEEFYISDVISGWMKLNYVLTINGYKVINGYSDILSPVFGAVGGIAGATGWWSNLRYFKMERFIPTRTGGRMPIPRYLSTLLYNRIKFDELDLVSSIIPEVKNNLTCDEYYDPEPDNREEEMLQSWEALKFLNNKLTSEGSDVELNLKIILNHIKKANNAYNNLKLNNIRLDNKSNGDHLLNIQSAIQEFQNWAEIG